MRADLSFPHNYKVELLEEYPLGRKIYYYPGANTIGGSDGLIVKIDPIGGEAWIGIFAFGNLGPNGLYGIYTLPNPNRICVVSQGVGYIVSVLDPTKWEDVKVIPVMVSRYGSELTMDLSL